MPRGGEFGLFEHREDHLLPNPEVLQTCLVAELKALNRMDDNDPLARRRAVAAETTVVGGVDGDNFAMKCGKCGLRLFVEDGTLWGARNCPRVEAGEIILGELG